MRTVAETVVCGRAAFECRRRFLAGGPEGHREIARFAETHEGSVVRRPEVRAFGSSSDTQCRRPFGLLSAQDVCGVRV